MYQKGSRRFHCIPDIVSKCFIMHLGSLLFNRMDTHCRYILLGYTQGRYTHTSQNPLRFPQQNTQKDSINMCKCYQENKIHPLSMIIYLHNLHGADARQYKSMKFNITIQYFNAFCVISHNWNSQK